MSAVNLVGYHGTALGNVDNILENQFVASKRDDHWLGQGIYFYDDFELAKWWIETKLGIDPGMKYAVIAVNLNCQKEEFLDLDHHEGIDFYLAQLEKILRQLNFGLRFKNDEKSRTKNMCFSLDLLKQHLGLKLIAMTFQKFKPKYARGDIERFEERYFPLPLSVVYRERQICASANEVISSKKCVYSEV